MVLYSRGNDAVVRWWRRKAEGECEIAGGVMRKCMFGGEDIKEVLESLHGETKYGSIWKKK